MRSLTRPGLLVVVAVAAVALAAGWYTFWLVCDDAYIDFRYVSNAHRGLGYVWNAPPWRPVEGYTSFLWVVILDLCWRWTGTMPPDAAPWLSLGFSYASLAVIAGMTWRMPMSDALGARRVAVLAAVLFSTLSNRAFLAWTSGGLETPLFSAIVLAWVAVGTLSGPPFLLAAIAAVMCLTRPDGLLFAAATAAILAVRWDGRRTRAAAAWVVVPLAHLGWRVWFYGYLLPNSYYAKHVGPWPLAGAAYFASFALEYCYWVWLGVVAMYLLRRGADRPRLAPAIAIGAVVLHWAYYTFDVGGDHFEYRVYHHLVPLIAISFFALGDAMRWSPRRIFASFATMTALGLVVPWTHWAYTHTAVLPKDKGSYIYPIADVFPLPVRPYVMAWDELQRFLIGSFVCIRHQGHKTYASFQVARFPSREVGEKLPTEGLPVFAHTSIGYPAWTMPGIAILDERGLNDLVVARTKPLHTGQLDRAMAHDRLAPKEYVTCFHPNVRVGKHGTVIIAKRATPLLAADVIRCEDRWLDQAVSH
jgi:arabinofuranosyltransferase